LAEDCVDLSCSLTELKGLVERGIEKEKEQREDFDRYSRPPWLTIVFLVALFLVNLPIFLTYESYLPIWIISSFALIMVVWFLVLLPTSMKQTEESEKKDKEKKEKGGLSGLKENKKTLFNVLWNIFFINCQPLAPGVIILQLLNIILVVYGQYYTDLFSQTIAGLVIFQAVMIIAFYGGVTFFKPWTVSFLRKMILLSKDSKEKWHAGMRGILRVILFFAAIAVGVALVMIVAILFPGMTLSNFIEALGENWQTNFLLFLLTLATQFFLIRYLQGISSVEMMKGVATHRIDVLEREVLPNINWMLEGSDPDKFEALEGEATDDETRLKQNYLITRVWEYGKHDFFGIMPVFLIAPNTKLIMNKDFMTAVQGRAVPVS